MKDTVEQVLLLGKYDYFDVEPEQQENGLYGFYTKRGEEVFPPQWDDTNDFTEEGLAAVKKDGLWGFINTDGQLALPYQWEDASSFSEGCCGVKERGGGWVFIDTKGNLLFRTPWKAVEFFSEELCAVQDENGLWGFIDKMGNLVIRAQWHEVGDFQEGFAAVMDKDEKWGFISQDGELVIRAQWNEAKDFQEGFAAVMDKDEKWGFISQDGKLVVPCKWKTAGFFMDGMFLVWDENDDIQYLDSEGEIIQSTKKYEDGYDNSGKQGKDNGLISFIILVIGIVTFSVLYLLQNLPSDKYDVQPKMPQTEQTTQTRKVVHGLTLLDGHVHEGNKNYKLTLWLEIGYKEIAEYQEEVSKELLGVNCQDIGEAFHFYCDVRKQNGAPPEYPLMEVRLTERHTMSFPELYTVMCAKKVYINSPGDTVLLYQKDFALDLLNHRLLTLDNVFVTKEADKIRESAGDRRIMVIPQFNQMDHEYDFVNNYVETRKGIYDQFHSAYSAIKPNGVFSECFVKLREAICKQDAYDIVEVPLPFDKLFTPKAATLFRTNQIKVKLNKRTRMISIIDFTKGNPVIIKAFYYQSEKIYLLSSKARAFIESQLSGN